jgi:NAD(P)-dependent dehydrogenase (short-subunit alcohol dehydrogenase family)
MPKPLRFDDEVVIVTGAAGGLGRSQALELARRGARVVVNDLGGSPLGGGADPELAQAVVRQIEAAGGQAIASIDSVSSEHGPRQIIELALDKWGRVDGIVANAAILRNAHFEDITVADWDALMDVNLKGLFRSVQAAYRAMKSSGGGRVVAMTSASGLCGAFGQASYAASKLGVVGLIRTIAWEGARYHIKANAVSPGAMDTRAAEVTFTADNAAYVDRPPELAFPIDQPMTLDTLTASRVTPMVLPLLHRSCPVSGEIYAATGGLFYRFLISHTHGVGILGEPSAEDVVNAWNKIRGAGEVPSEVDGEAIVWGMKAAGERLARLAAGSS